MVENIVEGSKIKHSIIGIGLNLNQIEFPSFKREAISLSNFLKTELNREGALDQILKCIKESFVRFGQIERDQLSKLYLDKLFCYQQKSNFILKGTPIEGIIIGTGLYGKLRIEVKGIVEEYDLKEVEFID